MTTYTDELELRNISKGLLNDLTNIQDNITKIELLIFKKSFEIYNNNYNINETSFSNPIKEIYIDLIREFIRESYFKTIDKTYKNFDLNKFLWNSNNYDEARDNELKEIKNIQTPIAIVENNGLYTCYKCNQSKTMSYDVQTRRADEGGTIFVNCMNKDCLNRWVIH